MTVFDNLTKKKDKRVMMNAPAHKGKTSLPYLKKFSANVDISDFPNSDGEYEAIKEAEARAAELWGADASYIVTGGSAAGMLAAIYAHTVEGTEVLVARNCPKYVYNALEVCRVIPRYIVPDSDKLGFFGSIDPKDVEDALIAYRNVRLVIITSPTAEGVISDVSEISRITRARGIPLIVDEPCGAHLGFSDFF
ncbi:MAG: amino acid decarboxylase, partial [Clostridiales bacterium]|nr:amino acid decarboxylase [Clostridiales bacterium]